MSGSSKKKKSIVSGFGSSGLSTFEYQPYEVETESEVASSFTRLFLATHAALMTNFVRFSASFRFPEIRTALETERSDEGEMNRVEQKKN